MFCKQNAEFTGKSTESGETTYYVMVSVVRSFFKNIGYALI